MFLHQRRNLVQLILGETAVVFQPDGLQPELRGFTLTRHVNMRRFAPVAGKEKEPVWTALEDRRTHDEDSASFSVPTAENSLSVLAPEIPLSSAHAVDVVLTS